MTPHRATAEELTRALEGAAWTEPGDMLLRLAGPDAPEFLNRLLTVDCRRLAEGASTRAFLLGPQGRVELTLRLLRVAPAEFWAEALDGSAVTAALDRYHFGERFTCAPLPRRRWTLMGPGAEGALATAGLGRVSCPTADVVAVASTRLGGALDLWIEEGAAAAVADALEQAGASPVCAATLEVLRVAEGVPEAPSEYGPGSTPLDVSPEGITEGKGCYPGQEVIERTLALGRPARALRRVRVEGEPARDGGLALDETAVGQLTSLAWAPDGALVGLALVKQRHADAPAFRSGDARVTPEVRP